MANIEKRAHGPYRVKGRRKGYAPHTAPFHMLTAAVLEGQHFPMSEAKRHTLADVTDRSVATVLPRKQPSTMPSQRRHFAYWRTHLGAYTLSAITPGMIATHRDLLARNRLK
jgi:hypothetical protein